MSWFVSHESPLAACCEANPGFPQKWMKMWNFPHSSPPFSFPTSQFCLSYWEDNFIIGLYFIVLYYLLLLLCIISAAVTLLKCSLG